jgi:hypothetical protein
MKVIFHAKSCLVLTILALTMAACGDGKSSSSSSSYSGPSGLDSAQKDKYNNLTPEGKKYVDDQMRAYDKGKQ